MIDEHPSASFRAFVDEHGLKFPAFHDPSREVIRDLQALGTPTYLIINPQGEIRFHGTSLDELRRSLAVLRNQGAGGSPQD